MKASLSEDAARDAAEIYRYSFITFGETQAERYFDALERSIAIIGEQPHIGRAFDHVKAKARRHECLAHSIYYRVQEDRVLILRILGADQDPGRHL